MKSLVVLLSLFVFTSALLTAQQAKPAQTQPPQRPPWLNTPQVHSDNSVTFQFLAPNAQEVKLTREGTPEPLPMQKDDKGVWTVNTRRCLPTTTGTPSLLTASA
jgi:1,4-alpha-glucan branching enzyme